MATVLSSAFGYDERMDLTRSIQLWMAFSFGAIAVGCVVLRMKGLPLHDLLAVGGTFIVLGIVALGAWHKRTTNAE